MGLFLPIKYWFKIWWIKSVANESTWLAVNSRIKATSSLNLLLLAKMFNLRYKREKILLHFFEKNVEENTATTLWSDV